MRALVVLAAVAALSSGQAAVSTPEDRQAAVNGLSLHLLDENHASRASQTPLEAEGLRCRIEKVALKARIAAVYDDFASAPAPAALDTLVTTDGRIRAALQNRPQYRPCESDRELIYDPRWERMGVHVGYWDDLAYTGALLVAAHRQAPDSPLRSYTLFSTVFGETPPHVLGVMPDVAAARAYAAEFPEGPFVREAYIATADFHKDLFMVLRDGLHDFKYECFKPHIEPGLQAAQRDRAQRIAVEYYERALTLDPDDERIRSTLALTRAGTIRAWSFCAD